MLKKPLLFSCSVIYLFSLSAISSIAYGATSPQCPGEEGYMFTNYRGHATKNPTKGGFVSNSAFVDDSAYIAPTAAVCNSASVLEQARVYGNAVISGEAEVTDKARVFGNARVSGTAFVAGTAKISDHAQVTGETIVEGVAWIRGYSKLTSGVFTEGTQNSVKPQSVINAENKAAAEKAQRQAEARKQQELAQKREAAKSSVREISRLLGRGDYASRNYNRQTETSYTWSVDEIDSSSCAIGMRVSRTEKGINDGQKIGSSRSENFTISLKNYSFDVNDEDSYYYTPQYCMHSRSYDRYYSFCFGSFGSRNDLLSKMKEHHLNYCRS